MGQPLKETVAIKHEPEITIVQQEPSQPSRVSSSQAEKKIGKPRLSLVERQSLMNSNRPTTSDTTTSRKRRKSSLHKHTISNTTNSSADIFRFPSESPPKQQQPFKRPPTTTTTTKPLQRLVVVEDGAKVVVEDKENNTPLSTWPVVIGGRERRQTFNVTMEKLARMTREEMQADKEWEAALANKRRRQSVAI